MTTETAIVSAGGTAAMLLIAILGWFLRKLILDLESKVGELSNKLTTVESRFADFKVMVEQNFVNFETFETMRTEFRNSLREIYAAQAKAAETLARLDERSQLGERIGSLIDVLAKTRRK